jgi:L-threonylcarbamoyladenylate synthase
MPEPEIIEAAANIINAGGVIVFPTKSLYGLGVDALNATAVEALFRIKKRPQKKPVLVLIHDIADLNQLVEEIPETALGIMETFWPGEVTIVFEASPEIPGILTAGTGKIGVRMAGHPVARALAKRLKHPITGTSANISGQPGCSGVTQLQPDLTVGINLILDAGPLSGGIGSTVVDVTRTTPEILREGSIPADEILKAIKAV